VPSPPFNKPPALIREICLANLKIPVMTKEHVDVTVRAQVLEDVKKMLRQLIGLTDCYLTFVKELRPGKHGHDTQRQLVAQNVDDAFFHLRRHWQLPDRASDLRHLVQPASIVSFGVGDHDELASDFPGLVTVVAHGRSVLFQ